MTVDGSLMTANDTDESVPVTTAEEEEGGGGGYVCGGATDTELELFYKFSWWNEGVLQVHAHTAARRAHVQKQRAMN